MSTTTIVDVVGTPLDRVDGRLKVTGAATYPIDVNPRGVAYAALVGSTVTSGRILHIAVDAAERAPGVLAVITHLNTPPLASAPATRRMGDPIGPQPLPPFQSDAVLHYGQHVAMVVAETREEANAAAALIEVTYQHDTPVLSYGDPRASRVSYAWTPDFVRGAVPSAHLAFWPSSRTSPLRRWRTGRTRPSVRSRCRPSKATPCCIMASTSRWSLPRRWSTRRRRRR